MAGRNLQMRGYTRLVSPNMGREEAEQRSREGSSQAAINNGENYVEENAEKIHHIHDDRIIHQKEKLKLAF